MNSAHSPFISEIEAASISGSDLLELATEVLKQGASFRFRATGGSMTPFILDGDVLTIRPLDAKDPAMGDVLAFAHPANGRLAVHRVVGLRDGACLIKGDGSRQPDGWVPRSELLGKLAAVDRGGQSIRLGLGWERIAVALLLRMGLLNTVIAPGRLVARWMRKER